MNDPSGKSALHAHKREAIRFVVLKHEGIPDPHFDLMFQRRGAESLTTWRSSVWPIIGSTPLLRLADHRLIYLDFEGPLTRNRGFVRRISAGRCDVNVDARGTWWIHFSDPPCDLQITPVESGWVAWSADPSVSRA
jgi:hypothetical protein